MAVLQGTFEFTKLARHKYDRSWSLPSAAILPVVSNQRGNHVSPGSWLPLKGAALHSSAE